MEARTNNFVDAGRGVGVAIALVGLVLGVFFFFAYGRHWHLPNTAEPTPRVASLQHPEGSSPKAAQDDDDGTAPPGAPGSSALPSSASGHTASNAADALRQVLQSYKADPQKTTNATISSTGQVRVQKGGALTSLDGLPARVVGKGTVLSGTARP
jgi:hypothetical protein